MRIRRQSQGDKRGSKAFQESGVPTSKAAKRDSDKEKRMWGLKKKKKTQREGPL